MDGYNDPSVIYDFPTPIMDEVSLMSSWNLISFDLEIEENATEDVFADIIGDDNLVYVTGFGETGAQFFDPYGLPFLNTLTEINPGFGFWVKINDGTTLVQEGMEMGQGYSFNIMASWNLMSYWPQVSITPQDAFSELIEDGNLMYVTGFDETGAHFFDPNGLPFLNTLEVLENGYGYWVKVNEAVDGFQYPVPTAVAAKSITRYVNPDIVRTNQFMFVNGTVTFDHIDYNVSDRISVLTASGRLVGEIEILEDNLLMTAPIYGDDWTTEEIDGALKGENLRFIYNSNEAEKTIAYTGTMDLAKIDLEFRSIPNAYTLSQNYPNPFNPVTTILFSVPQNGVGTQHAVSLQIFDITGRLIETLIDEELEPGYHTIQWNAEDSFGKPVSAGIYLYQIRTAGFVQTKKMVLLK
jgi:hypothetical protein